MQECYNAAIKLLARSEKTVTQLKQKLAQKEFPAQDIEKVILKLIDYNFINDERFAKQFTQNRQKKKSNRQLIFELKQKGVDEATAKDCLLLLEDEQQRCLQLAQEKHKKLMKKPNLQEPNNRELQQKINGKIQLYLASKGFSINHISKALQTISQKDAILE